MSLKRPAAGAVLLAVLACLAASGEAGAQERRRIAVRITRAGGVVTPELADTITEVWIGSIAGQSGIEMLGSAELQAQLGQTEEDAVRCTSSVACLGHVGAALNADMLVIGSLGRQGNEFRLDVSLIDIATARVANRRVERVAGGVESLVRAVRRIAPELLREPPRPASLHLTSDPSAADVYLDDVRVGSTPIRLPNVAPGPHALRVTRGGYRPSERSIQPAAGAVVELRVELEALPPEPVGRAEEGSGWPAWLFWGTTLLATGAAGGGGFTYYLSQQPIPLRSETETRALEARQREMALYATGLFIGAGAMAATAILVLLLKPGRPARPSTQAALSIGPGPLGIALAF